MGKRELEGIRRETARTVLWQLHEENLPHLMDDHRCYVKPVIEELVQRAGWTYDSYFLASFFNEEELLVEIGEGA